MCVHGIAISTIVQIKRMAWGTVARWLESASTYAQRFNRRMLRGFVIHELQADEIRTFAGAKKRVIWVLTTLEVWSRLWVSGVVGRRNFRNIKRVILNTLQRGRFEHRFLFTTDGFEVYEWAAKRLLSGICIYGQVIKKRRENRVVRVDRRLLLGTQAELEETLFHSEDSTTLNTSFIERHNLTIRQGCSYLGRRTSCHARHTEFLEGQVALLMAYYNFVRPHSALRFGKTVRTPAMQAGLVRRRLSFRGGSNGARPRAWKKFLQERLADPYGLTITVAHYPPGASKWNPIDHRMFSEITKNWAGEPLQSFQTLVNFARNTRTQTGLRVRAYRDRRLYEKGIKVSDKEMLLFSLLKSDFLGQWNYTISPRPQNTAQAVPAPILTTVQADPPTPEILETVLA